MELDPNCDVTKITLSNSELNLYILSKQKDFFGWPRLKDKEMKDNTPDQGQIGAGGKVAGKIKVDGKKLIERALSSEQNREEEPSTDQAKCKYGVFKKI